MRTVQGRLAPPASVHVLQKGIGSDEWRFAGARLGNLFCWALRVPHETVAAGCPPIAVVRRRDVVVYTGWRTPSGRHWDTSSTLAVYGVAAGRVHSLRIRFADCTTSFVSGWKRPLFWYLSRTATRRALPTRLEFVAGRRHSSVAIPLGRRHERCREGT